MALATCRECGRQVSTEAVSCPHCGARDPAVVREGATQTPPPVQKPGLTSFKIVLGCALGLIAAIALVGVFFLTCAGGTVAWFGGMMEEASEDMEAQEDSILGDTVAMQAADTATVGEILDAYSNNAVAAADRFERKPLVLIGEVRSVGGNSDRAFIFLEAGRSQFRTVTCHAEGENARAAASLNRGDRIRLLGLFEERDWSGDISLRRCRILE